MQLASLLSTLGLAAFASSPAPCGATLTTHPTTYDLMTGYMRLNLAAMTRAALNEKKQLVTTNTASLIRGIEDTIADGSMTFDMYRGMRSAYMASIENELGTAYTSQLSKNIAQQADELSVMPLVFFAPDAMADVFYDTVDTIAETIEIQWLKDISASGRDEIEAVAQSGEWLNPSWVALRMAQTFQEIEAKNATLAKAVDGTIKSLDTVMEGEYGNSDL